MDRESTTGSLEGIDLDGLLCALVLAPHAYARNRFFTLFQEPKARRVRSRAIQLRTMVRHLAGREPPRGEMMAEERLDGDAIVHYRVVSLNLRRTVRLSPLEQSIVRYALHRAGSEGLTVPPPALDEGDRLQVEHALARLRLPRAPIDPAISTRENPAMCIFCKIVSGELPAKKLHEDEELIAFADIHPVAPTHFLVIPKRHIPSLAEATDGDTMLLGRLLSVAREIASTIGLDTSGYRTIVNTGEDAGQSVFHLHVHVLGGRAMPWPPS